MMTAHHNTLRSKRCNAIAEWSDTFYEPISPSLEEIILTRNGNTAGSFQNDALSHAILSIEMNKVVLSAHSPHFVPQLVIFLLSSIVSHLGFSFSTKDRVEWAQLPIKHHHLGYASLFMPLFSPVHALVFPSRNEHPHLVIFFIEVQSLLIVIFIDCFLFHAVVHD